MIHYPKKLLEPIQKHLKKEYTKVIESLSQLKKEDPFTNPTHLIDDSAPDSEAYEQSSHERIESLREELKEKKEEIKSALKRIETGTYGICRSCKRIIETDRLTIMPTASECISCERKREQK